MGLLDNITHKEYYQGNNLGNYQFTSLDHIISQFEIAYVGENKIIPKANRADIAFHAQRALQELSFDTFKSIKAQQIDLPPTLVMPLPHDYVNYTKISQVDSAGIKRLLYPVKETSNPFEIRQLDNGTYNFPSGPNFIIPPLLNAEPGILSRMVIISVALLSFSVILITLFHSFSFSSYVWYA